MCTRKSTCRYFPPFNAIDENHKINYYYHARARCNQFEQITWGSEHHANSKLAILAAAAASKAECLMCRHQIYDKWHKRLLSPTADGGHSKTRYRAPWHWSLHCNKIRKMQMKNMKNRPTLISLFLSIKHNALDHRPNLIETCSPEHFVCATTQIDLFVMKWQWQLIITASIRD